jgi:molecular chaperone DnaK (HSP70)
MTIALDFGTCNTVIARWNEGRDDVEVPSIRELTKTFPYLIPGKNTTLHAKVIPSLIHYGEGDSAVVGYGVERDGLVDHPATFRWTKMDLLKGNTRNRRANGRLVNPRQAASELLDNILLFAQGALGGPDEEVVATVPVEADDFYVDWLRDTVGRQFRRGATILDEATACILGYRERVKDDEVYVIVDFGGGTLDVSLVRTDLDAEGLQKCRLLGRAGEEIGGMLVDKWLLERLVQEARLPDQDVRDVGTILLPRIEEAKIALSNHEPEFEITQLNDLSGTLISHTFAAGDLREILESKDVYALVTQTIDRALEAANTKYGTQKSAVQGVFLVGGSSLLLGLPKLIVSYFPRCKVYCSHPFEAIARGACRYLGQDFNPTLVHDYCLRVWNPDQGAYADDAVVEKGTQYPTEKPVSARYLKSACHEAQTLDIEILERSYMTRPDGWDPWAVQASQDEDRNLRVLARLSEFVVADPPCAQGERRFMAAFGVDEHKRLTISLKDLQQGNRSYIQLPSGERLPWPQRDIPVVRL